MGRSTGLPSAHDVARVAGVSQAAVSRAFTPGTSISAATREKVLEAAKELGYRPNLLARSLIKGRSDIVGVVVGFARNPFFTVVLDLLSRRLRQEGRHLLVFTGEQDATTDVHVEDLLKYRVDGLIMLWSSLSPDLADECRAQGIPVVFLTPPTSTIEGFATVTGANEAGSRQIAAHLIQQGYRSFAFVAGYESSISQEREAGFTAELVAQGFLPPERAFGQFRREGGTEAARRLLSGRPRPEAIFCANDQMALAAIEVARYEFGIEVGRELGIAGFGGIDECAWPTFDLTTYAQPVRRMIEVVADIVLEGDVTNVAHVVLEGELKVRGSTGRS